MKVKDGKLLRMKVKKEKQGEFKRAVRNEENEGKFGEDKLKE